MTTRRLSFLLALLCISFIPVLGQGVSLAGYLSQLRKNHPYFEKTQTQVEMARAGREATLGTRDWLISGGPRLSHQRDIYGGLNPETLNQIGASLSADKALWGTGGRLSLEWSPSLARFQLPDISIGEFEIPLGPSQFYQNNLILSYRQPLLRNFRGHLDRLDYELSSYTVEATEIEVIEGQENFLLSMALEYLDWVLMHERLVIARERLHLANRQLEQVRKKREANLVDQVDVLRTEDDVQLVQQQAALLASQFQAKGTKLAWLAKYEANVNLIPQFDLYQRKPLPSPDAAISRLQSQARTLKSIAVHQAQLERHRRGLMETARPDLTLDTRVALKSGSSTFSSIFEHNAQDAGLLLRFSYPIDNRTARAKVRQKALEQRQLELEASEVALQLEAQLRAALIQIREMEQVLALNQAQIETAIMKTQEELKRYNQGRGDLAFVIQSQDNEERARLNYARNATAYHKLHLQLKALLDELLPDDTAGTE